MKVIKTHQPGFIIVWIHLLMQTKAITIPLYSFSRMLDVIRLTFC
jgi:hypothetical protein